MKTWVRKWLDEAGDRLNCRPYYAVVFFSVFYFALMLPAADLKPYWYDELFTWATATRDSLGELIDSLRQGWDLQPPLYYLMVRVGRRLTDSELGIRLPSVAGLWLGSIFLFLHMRRLIPPVFAASALFLPCMTMLAPFAVEARPYALLFCFATAALLCWGESVTSPARWPRAGLFLSLVLTSTVHYFGFIAFVALGAGEVAHVAIRRKVRWDIVCIFVLASVPSALHWPLMSEAMEFSSIGAFNAPSFSLLPHVYGNVLTGLLALAVTLLWALRSDVSSRLPIEQAVAWTVMMLSPVAGLAAAFAVSGMLLERYVLFWHCGVIAMLLYATARLANNRPWVGVLLLGLTASQFIYTELQILELAVRERKQMEESLASLEGLMAEPRFRHLPMIVTDAFLAFRTHYYVPRSIRHRILYLGDAELQPLGSPQFAIDHDLTLSRSASFPLTGEDAMKFYARGGSFLLAYSEAWGAAAKIRIHQHGCSMTPAGDWSGQTLYLVERCNGKH